METIDQQTIFDALEHVFPAGFEPPEPASPSPGNYAAYLAWAGPDPLTEQQILDGAEATRARRGRLAQVAAGRAALREQWAGLPAWIRGPYATQWAAATSLVDAGDWDAAIALIEYQEPMPSYDETQVSAFGTVRASLAAALEELRALAEGE